MSKERVALDLFFSGSPGKLAFRHVEHGAESLVSRGEVWIRSDRTLRDGTALFEREAWRSEFEARRNDWKNVNPAESSQNPHPNP